MFRTRIHLQLLQHRVSKRPFGQHALYCYFEHSSRKAGVKRGEAATLHNLGDVYRRMGKLDKSLEAENKALAIARQIGDKKGESSYLVSIGQIHKRGGNLDRALAAFRESMQIEMERKDDVALRYPREHDGSERILFVGRAQEKTLVFRTQKRRNPVTGVSYAWLAKEWALPNHFYF